MRLIYTEAGDLITVVLINLILALHNIIEGHVLDVLVATVIILGFHIDNQLRVRHSHLLFLAQAIVPIAQVLLIVFHEDF